MRRILSCQFNIDTACVDVEYALLANMQNILHLPCLRLYI